MEEKQLGFWTELLFRLTVGRVFLGISAVVFGGLAYASFENRQTIFTLVLSNPAILGALGVGALLCLIGYIVTELVRRNDDLNAIRMKDVSDRLAGVELELVECRRVCKDEGERMHLEMIEIIRQLKNG